MLMRRCPLTGSRQSAHGQLSRSQAGSIPGGSAGPATGAVPVLVIVGRSGSAAACGQALYLPPALTGPRAARNGAPGEFGSLQSQGPLALTHGRCGVRAVRVAGAVG